MAYYHAWGFDLSGKLGRGNSKVKMGISTDKVHVIRGDFRLFFFYDFVGIKCCKSDF